MWQPHPEAAFPKKRKKCFSTKLVVARECKHLDNDSLDGFEGKRKDSQLNKTYIKT